MKEKKRRVRRRREEVRKKTLIQNIKVFKMLNMYLNEGIIS